MSTGTLQRLEQRLLAAWHVFDHIYLRKIIMEGFARLSNDLDQAVSALSAAQSDSAAKDTKIADLEQQLAAAQAKPVGGASEDQLNALADKLEAALSKGGSSAGPAPAPIVGSDTTTVTHPETGAVTTLDHATGETATTDASGTPIPTDTQPAAAAVGAAVAAGVAVPGAA